MKNLFVVKTDFDQQFELTDMLIVSDWHLKMWKSGIENMPDGEYIPIFFGINALLDFQKENLTSDKILFERITDSTAEILQSSRLTNNYFAEQLFRAVIEFAPEYYEDIEDDDEVIAHPV